MKHLIFLIAFLFYSFMILCQTMVEWSSDYKIKIEDFQSPQTEINTDLTTYSVFSGTNMDFSFQMTNYEFMFTKNFNSKVRAIFNKKAAVIAAPDSLIANQLVNVSQYHFDLCELYARKFRKQLYEEKGTFSDISFVQPIFNKLQEEINAESAKVFKETELGKNEKLLKEEHQKILQEIEKLPNFCQNCKPPKKGKSR